MLLLKEIGLAYLYLTEFECKRTVKHLSQLPPHQKNTGWVLSLIAKAYFEMSDYNHAVKLVSSTCKMHPSEIVYFVIRQNINTTYTDGIK